MSDYRTLNRTVTAKVETTPGTDATPTVGANAVKVEDPQVAGNIEALQTNEVGGGLDRDAAVPGGGGGAFSCGVNVKGSGAGGTAPEWGALLRGCGLAETVLAADITGTATAGGASSITLASATNVEIGHVITTTGGTGPGQTRVITGLDGAEASVYPDWTTEPDATTEYAIKASALYVPASAGLAHLSIYDYLHSSSSGVDSKLRKVLGAVGNLQLTFGTSGIVRADFNFTGKFSAPSEVSHPGAATFDNQRPISFKSADVSLGGKRTKFNQLTLDLGNEIVAADDPGDEFGVDVGQITRRGITGRINPPVAIHSDRNVWSDFLAGTDRKLWVRYGTPGNGVSLYIPELRYTGSEDEDINGLAHEGIPFAARGEDTGIYLNIY